MKLNTTKNLFTPEEANTFISFLDDDIDKNIAKMIFIDGLKNEDIADTIGYSKRHTERLRASLMVKVIIKLIKLHTPKVPVLIDGRSVCPTCHNNKSSLNITCDNCGQALDFTSDSVNSDIQQCTIGDYPNAWDPGGNL